MLAEHPSFDYGAVAYPLARFPQERGTACLPFDGVAGQEEADGFSTASARWRRSRNGQTSTGPRINGLVFSSRGYTVLVRSDGLRQEFIMPHCPGQNRMIECVIRTLKEQCTQRRRCAPLQHANRVIEGRIGFYKTGHPHQALGNENTC